MSIFSFQFETLKPQVDKDLQK